MKHYVSGLRYAANLVNSIKVPPPEKRPKNLEMTDREAHHAHAGSVVMQKCIVALLNEEADKLESAGVKH